MEGKNDHRSEKQSHEVAKESESIKKMCVAIKYLSLYQGLFLARPGVVCFLFYLNEEVILLDWEGFKLTKELYVSLDAPVSAHKTDVWALSLQKTFTSWLQSTWCDKITCTKHLCSTSIWFCMQGKIVATDIEPEFST